MHFWLTQPTQRILSLPPDPARQAPPSFQGPKVRIPATIRNRRRGLENQGSTLLPFSHLGDTMSGIHKLLVGLGGPKPLNPHSLSLFCVRVGMGLAVSGLRVLKGLAGLGCRAGFQQGSRYSSTLL